MAYGKLKADTLIYDNSGSDVEVTLASLGNKANLASPTFTGTVTIPTPSADDNTTKAASTAYVQTELGDYLTTALGAPKASPAFTGTATGVNLTLSGNLTVNGTTTTVATTNTTVKDNLLELNNGASSNANDSGILIERGSTGDNAIIAWDESADKFIVGTTTAANDATGDLTIATGTLVANVEGNVTGTVTGTATGLAGSPNVTVGTIGCGAVTGTSTVSDSKGNLRSIPSNAQGSAHVATAADAGKAIYISTGGVTLNNSVFAAGDAVTIINNSGSDQTITQGSGVTIHNAADAATGNRTLAGRGMATVWFASASVAYISGAGLS